VRVVPTFFENLRGVKGRDLTAQNRNEPNDEVKRRRRDPSDREKEASARRQPVRQNPMIEQNAEEENAEREGRERAKRRRQVDAANGGAGLGDAFEERFFGATSVGVVKIGRSGGGRGHFGAPSWNENEETRAALNKSAKNDEGAENVASKRKRRRRFPLSTFGLLTILSDYRVFGKGVFRRLGDFRGGAFLGGGLSTSSRLRNFDRGFCGLRYLLILIVLRWSVEVASRRLRGVGKT
jgi:hypothetical protein